MERHQENAFAIANYLETHSKVERIFYPGLESDPQYAMTKRQLRGTSGLMSFVLKDRSREAAMKTVDRLKYFGIGCSWGGFESRALAVTVPATVVEPGVSGNCWMIRLHAGLENSIELI